MYIIYSSYDITIHYNKVQLPYLVCTVGDQPIGSTDHEGGARTREEVVLLNRTFGSMRLDVLLLVHYSFYVRDDQNYTVAKT